jgi:N-acetylneuraminic acid mutarotase
VLVANGIGADGHTTPDTEVYDPSTDSWSSAGAITRRYLDAAVRLNDGRAMVIGGLNLSGLVNDPEIYDPATNRWSAAAPMHLARDGHVAVTLQDGRVLVAGGNQDLQTPMSSVEIYDPSSNSWSSAASMMVPRMYFAAILLDSGKVLVAGGGESGPVAEVYDPASDSWSATGPVQANHFDETLTRLSDGKVLMVGGGGDNNVAPTDVEVYDPATNNWTVAASLPEPRWDDEATLLSDGTVLVTGGDVPYADNQPLSSTLIFNWNTPEPGGLTAAAPSASAAPTTGATASAGASLARAQPAVSLPEVPVALSKTGHLAAASHHSSWPFSPFLLAVLSGAMLILMGAGGLALHAIHQQRRRF